MKLKGNEEFFVSGSCEPDGLKTLPVRLGGADAKHPLVGFLPKSLLSNKDASA
jgi:hypothetical protein